MKLLVEKGDWVEGYTVAKDMEEIPCKGEVRYIDDKGVYIDDSAFGTLTFIKYDRVYVIKSLEGTLLRATVHAVGAHQ